MSLKTECRIEKSEIQNLDLFQGHRQLRLEVHLGLLALGNARLERLLGGIQILDGVIITTVTIIIVLTTIIITTINIIITTISTITIIITMIIIMT